jgi:hypothetical protein
MVHNDKDKTYNKDSPESKVKIQICESMLDRDNKLTRKSIHITKEERNPELRKD